MRRSFPSSIDASLMVVYSDGEGVVPKGKHSHRKASFPTIAVHVEAIYAFVRMCRYSVSISVFPIRINFEGHLMRMAEIMWSILSMNNS